MPQTARACLRFFSTGKVSSPGVTEVAKAGTARKPVRRAVEERLQRNIAAGG